MISKIALFLSIFRLTAAGDCSNGVGGQFVCHYGTSDQEVARLACESVYGSCQWGYCGRCTTGSCGEFHYYRGQNHWSCNCNKPVGQYEFIYKNIGYANVGSDYSGTVDNVYGNGLFVRRKSADGCGPTSWKLILSDLGAERYLTETPTENPTASPTLNPTTLFTASPTNVLTRIPCQDEFSWCVFPNICDNADFRLYCPFSCDDCLTASPTSIPTAFPTEDCATREDLWKGVIDHMLNHYLKSEEDEESFESSK